MILENEYKTTNLFLIPALRDGFSLSFDFDIDFHKNVFPTSSEKFITPVDGFIFKKK
jgi:hypothetical protein